MESTLRKEKHTVHYQGFYFLRLLPSSGVCKTEGKGASKVHDEREAKPYLLELNSWTAILYP